MNDVGYMSRRDRWWMTFTWLWNYISRDMRGLSVPWQRGVHWERTQGKR